MKKWVTHDEYFYAEADNIAKMCNISVFTAQMLINRGIDTYFKATQFLSPSFEHLPLMFSSCVDRIETAIINKEKIFIHGDYDVDGITATSIMTKAIRRLGGEVAYFIPNRFTHGYGIQNFGIDKAKTWGASVIITVDCGITAINQIAYAKSLGIDTVVIDHHFRGQVLPPTPWITATSEMPNSARYSNMKNMCGAGLSFVFAVELAQRFKAYFVDEVIEMTIELAALGTIADMMPLIGMNRWIVQNGIDKVKRFPSDYIQALLAAREIDPQFLKASDIPFRVTPVINAAGRLKDASLVLNLFFSENEMDAQVHANTLSELNEERKMLQEKFFVKCRQSAEIRNTDSVFVYGEYPEGLVGLLANNLMEQYNVPAIVLSEHGDILKGSGRIPEAFNLFGILHECHKEKILLSFGGHQHAAGLSMKKENFERFCTMFDDLFRLQLHEISQTVDISEQYVDAVLKIRDIDERMIQEIEMLEPFGEGNHEPILICEGVQLANFKEVKGNGLKATAKQNGDTIDLIAFGMFDKLPWSQAYTYDIRFVPNINEWQGRRTIQMRATEIRLKNSNSPLFS